MCASSYRLNSSGVGLKGVLFVLLGVPILFFLTCCATNSQTISDGGSPKQQDLLNRNMPHINDSRRDLSFAFGEPIYPRMLLSKEISLIEDDKTFSLSSNDTSFEKTGSDRASTSPSEEKAFSDQEQQVLIDQYRDWKGIGRDASYFMGYQAVVAGALYLLPESVTNWTDEQKRTTANKWAENVQSATWDKTRHGSTTWLTRIGVLPITSGPGSAVSGSLAHSCTQRFSPRCMNMELRLFLSNHRIRI